jgi:uncharacterized protein with FMN-binding domain
MNVLLELKLITPQMFVTLQSTSVDLIANVTHSQNVFREGKKREDKAAV